MGPAFAMPGVDCLCLGQQSASALEVAQVSKAAGERNLSLRKGSAVPGVIDLRVELDGALEQRQRIHAPV